jgi:hypothetical protein
LHDDCTNDDDDNNNDETDECQPRPDDLYFANGTDAGSGTALTASRREDGGSRMPGRLALLAKVRDPSTALRMTV